jgi:phage/plasmid-like protein (TIGR03299 family)
MTDNTQRPIAPSGFRPNVGSGDPSGWDKAEYATPDRSQIDSGFYVEDRGLPWHVTLSRQWGMTELMTGSKRKLTSGEALGLAGLDYEVKMAQMFALVDDDYVEVPGLFTSYRADTGATLGSRGLSSSYKLVQNADALAFGDLLVDEGDAHWETAGSMKGGAIIFASMELPDSIHVDGDPSEYRLFLVISNGHNGKHPFRADVTIERVLCRNTLRIAHERAISSWTIRHTSSIEGRIQQARDALKLSFRYAETFVESASELVSTKLVDRQVDAILADLFPLTESQQERVDKDPSKLDAMPVGVVRRVYRESPTVSPVRGTAYGVMNAVSEYADHFKTYRSDEAKAEHLMFDDGDVKQRAWSLLTGIAK